MTDRPGVAEVLHLEMLVLQTTELFFASCYCIV
jgi:hypothetical protein